jgi:uncharacterized protein
MNKVKSRRVSIPVGDKEQTSGILTTPEKITKRTGVIVAHGDGNDMNGPLITFFSEGVAAAGYPVLRFNFLYKEQGRKTRDSNETLTRTWQFVFRFAEDAFGTRIDAWSAAGKSMGGYVASQMVADGILPVDRLIFLGYPLHAADSREKLRDEHLYKIRIPMLFFAGTHDPLCDLKRLQPVLKRLHASWSLTTIEGGDHSFHVPKSMGVPEEEIYGQIVRATVKWLAE